MHARFWPSVNRTEWAQTFQQGQMIEAFTALTGHTVLALLGLFVWWFHRSNWVSHFVVGIICFA